MEGERGVPNYEVQISFSSAPLPLQAIHEMGFVQFEDHHHNQVLSFLAPSSSHVQQHAPNPNNSHHHHQPAALSTGGTVSASATATSNTATMGFSTHSDLIVTRPPWNNNNDQVIKSVIDFMYILKWNHLILLFIFVML